MNKLELDITDQHLLGESAKALLQFAGNTKIFALEAVMGAGKTTFIKKICESLGSCDHFSSPTFSIVNEYHYPEGKIFHFDLFRLQTTEELYDIGFEEYLSSGNYCLIEWPALAVALLPKPYLKIEIKLLQNKRYLCSYFME